MCPEALVQRWSTPGRQIFNTYGPTETTVSASLAKLDPASAVTIGTPLPNYGMLVIEQDNDQNLSNDSTINKASTLRLAPRGSTGELCIFGPGVAAGYLPDQN